jgi:hypothetical protein
MNNKLKLFGESIKKTYEYIDNICFLASLK